jgi:hypothetical protein
LSGLLGLGVDIGADWEKRYTMHSHLRYYAHVLT